MEPTTRISLVEDNPAYRDVVKLALEDVSDLNLFRCFGTAEIAIRTFADSKPEDLPKLILLDLNLPGMSGLDAIPHIRDCVTNAKIIVLTLSDKEEDVLQAISLGASGYLLKSATVDQLIESIRTVRDGGASLDAGIAKFILSSLQTRLPKKQQESFLSNREFEILSLLASGHAKKEISTALKISYSTVDTYVSRIYKKLQVRNAPSAVDKAHRMGLFPTQE